MQRKLVEYTVGVDVDDSGELDESTMRDGIISGIQSSQYEGGLTTLSDETTLIRGFTVQHSGTSLHGALKNGTEKSLEEIASFGSVVIAHDNSRGMQDSDTYDITVKDAGGKCLIGTSVHDDEMDATVGRVMAATLRNHVFRGTYVVKLNPLEVMGLRGTLAQRIANHDWTPDLAAAAPNNTRLLGVPTPSAQRAREVPATRPAAAEAATSSPESPSTDGQKRRPSPRPM